MRSRLNTYFKVWWLTAANAAQSAFINRWSNALFMLGKILRLIMMLVFLFLLKDRQLSIAGYSSDQVVLFFLTYQIIDVTAQIFYRGVYVFSQKIRTGEFDFYLLRPISALFRALTGQPDLNDALFLVLFLPVMVAVVWQLDVHITLPSLLGYLVLLLNGFMIVTALHIAVLTIGVLTTEVDNIIWMYRDLIRLGQFPVTMYWAPIRFVLFFIVPIGLMITIPAQVLLNVPPSVNLGLATLLGIGSVIISLRAWHRALKQYSSASS